MPITGLTGRLSLKRHVTAQPELWTYIDYDCSQLFTLLSLYKDIVSHSIDIMIGQMTFWPIECEHLQRATRHFQAEVSRAIT